MIRIALYVWLTSISLATYAFELKVEPVSKNSYAIVGEIGPRTTKNHALNNTLGFVVTEAGVVLIGSGASPAGAELVEQAVASVTDQPIHLVVNIGVQDHHWMGNSYFADKGVPIKALKRTMDNQHLQVEAHLLRLKAQVGAEVDTIVPVFASEIVDEDQQEFRIGEILFKLLWPGDGHYAGDAVLWIAESQTLFSGDFVFHDRMLGIHPTSPVTKWQKAFHVIEQLEPLHVVPGHGHPGDLDRARRDTGQYLDWLTLEVGKALDDWQELGDTVEQLGDAPDFAHLKFYESWHKRNIHQTYMQIEAGRQ
jgi:glyoxylase-like metal-dependent hydrolase (beta-lactamase superfamily II)